MMTPAERDAFHAVRRTVIGGSDIGAICGVNPFKTEMQVYLEKVGAVEPEEENEAMHWGTVLEPVVIQEFCHQYNCNAKVKLPLARLDGHPHIGYHADGLLLDDERKPTDIIEAKTSGAWSRLPWGEAGTAEIPDTYNLQVQQGMLVYGFERAFMPVLIGGNDFRVFEIDRNEQLIANMIEVSDQFWQQVLDKTPPEIDGTNDSRRFLEALHPKDDGSTIQADSYLREWAARLRVARTDKAEAEARELLARNKITDKMKGVSRVEGPGFKITYKKSKDRDDTSWMSVAEALNAPPALIKKHTKIVKGSRSFRPTWKE